MILKSKYVQIKYEFEHTEAAHDSTLVETH